MPSEPEMVVCAACNAREPRRRCRIMPNGLLACDECYDEFTRLCDYCGAYYMAAATHFCEPDFYEAEEPEVPYGGATMPDVAESTDAWPWKTKVGYEVEFFTSHYAGDLRQCGSLHDDGSIEAEHGSGIEFASVPLAGAAVEKNVREVCRILDNIDADVNSSCGLHVHVEVAKYTDQQRFQIRQWWRKFERGMFLLAPYRRYANQYCRPTEQRQACDWVSERYHALNLQAYNEHGTYEFRLFTSTINADAILSRIAVCVAFVEWAANTPTMTALPANTAEEYLRFLGELCAPVACVERAIDSALTENPNRRADVGDPIEDAISTNRRAQEMAGVTDDAHGNTWYTACFSEYFDTVTLRFTAEEYWLTTPIKATPTTRQAFDQIAYIRFTNLEALVATGAVELADVLVTRELASDRLHQWLKEHPQSTT